MLSWRILAEALCFAHFSDRQRRQHDTSLADKNNSIVDAGTKAHCVLKTLL